MTVKGTTTVTQQSIAASSLRSSAFGTFAFAPLRQTSAMLERCATWHGEKYIGHRSKHELYSK